MKAIPIVTLFIAGLVAACGGDASGPSGAGGSPGGANRSTGTGSVTSETPAFNSAIDSKIVVNSTIDLEVDALRGAYVSVGQMVRSFGGYIADANITDNEKKRAASLRLRVPAARHDDLLTSLRELGGATVVAETTNAKEITEEYTNIEAELALLHRNEAQYQALLGQAASAGAITEASSRLETTRAEINRVQGRINLLNNLTDLATIGVSLTVPAAAAQADRPTPVEVFENALEYSATFGYVVLSIAAVLLALALWLVPMALIGLLGWKVARQTLPALKAKLL